MGYLDWMEEILKVEKALRVHPETEVLTVALEERVQQVSHKCIDVFGYAGPVKKTVNQKLQTRLKLQD